MINQNWVFSTNCGLDFTAASYPTPPTLFTSNLNPSGEGCASISDASGNLLFYTDGKTVWDETHAPVTTSSPLLGDSSSTQSSIIVPVPGNNKEYYIFTIDGSSNPAPPFNHFNGLRINVDTWVSTPISSHMVTPLLALPSTNGFSPAEKLTAIQHENCRDFWVVTVLQTGKDGTKKGSGINNGPGTFRVFLVDPTGISHVSDIPMNLNIDELGYLKASPNGQWLAIANGRNNNVLVYPFNKTTGAITIPSLINIPVPNVPRRQNRTAYGLEFSPNSDVLYFGNLGSGSQVGYLYQVDLTSSITANLIGTFPNGGAWYAIGALQLGVDGLIYIAKPGESSLGAITNPNVVAGVNVNQNYVSLSPNTCGLGLPNLLPNACENCNCSCSGCNQDAPQQNDDLIQRASVKDKIEPSTNNDPNCSNRPFPVPINCENQAIPSKTNIEPCFYFHWGDGVNDQIEEHDTEVFYITVCNNFNDILFKGLKITKVTLNPNLPISSAHIVPDRFINIDCLEPCSCQTREFAIITRDTNIAGTYTLDVEYCYDEIIISSGGGQGTASFPLEITED